MEINGLKRLLLLLLLIAGSSLANAELRVDGQWILVETQRVGRTEFTYTYRAEMVNRGADRSNVRASLSSTSPHTEVIDGHLHFGDVPSGARVLSSDTFRFRHDRLHGFNPGALRWTFHFAGKESSPDSDSEGEENRDRDSGEDDTQNEPVDDTSPDPDHPNTPDSNTELPPDPRTVAPPVEKTVATDFAAATAFLYIGSHPIQTGVAAGTIKPQRAAVLRGRVQTREGRSLSGVTVTVLNHAEYGQTLTREDGMFDLAVNGGRSLVVCYEKAGFLPVQRSIGVPWRDYTWLPDVVMIPLDNQVTTIDLTSSAAVQVARGSPVSDADGSRQATLLFIQGTTARMEFPDGSTQALPELSVRATEYTVGPSGPIAMPGELPPASGYTYAVELSVDQALTAGANTVRFSHPVLFYLENFLNFPVGETVPVGWYDRTQAAWLPADNGRIISILGVVDGLAVVDIDGKGQAADAQTLARWGITDAERAQLVDLYRPGQSLWRVSIDHFTSIDCNWPFVVPDDARGPSTPPPNADSTSDTKPKQEEKEDDPCEQGGSIVECQNQVLGESLWLTGTPFSLQYRSDRVVGRRAGFSLTIPLSGSSIPASLARIDLDIQIAGLRITRRFPATTEQSFRFRWNGKDGYGRTLLGSQPVTVRVGYVYKAFYVKTGVWQDFPDLMQRAFNLFGRLFPIIGTRDYRVVTFWQKYSTTLDDIAVLGVWDARAQGLGGWTLTAQHVYDPMQRMLYRGDGGRRSAHHQVVMTTVAGDGERGFRGDEGPAIKATLDFPQGIAVGPDGSLYIADSNNHRVRRVTPDGTIATVAGSGEISPSSEEPVEIIGDGGPATGAMVRLTPVDVALGPDGSFYIAETRNPRVRRVGLDGVITTVVGNGNPEFDPYSEEGGVARKAGLLPRSITVSSDGSLYIADSFNHRVFRVGADGRIVIVAGNGKRGFSGDGGLATDAQLNEPDDVLIGPNGNLYIADTHNHRIRRVGPDGIIATVAGNGEAGLSGDGGFATVAQLDTPVGIAVGADGGLYIADRENHRIRRVGPDGIIGTVAGGSDRGFNGNDGLATATWLDRPTSVVMGPDASLYITDSGNQRVRRVAPPLPGYSSTELLIPAEDGKAVYRFAANGRHLSTLDALTGAVRYDLAYDSAGLLIQVTDGDGDSTRIERDSRDNPTAIVAPNGQRTVLALDSNGYLASIANPAGETHTMEYSPEGLLTRFTDPRGNASVFAYDSLGRLISDTNAADGGWDLQRFDAAEGYQVIMTSAEGREVRYQVENLNTGDRARTRIAADGTTTTTLLKSDGERLIAAADGTLTVIQTGPDPRFGMQAPVPKEVAVATPAGLTATAATVRSVALVDPNDPLSLSELTKTVVINGHTWTSTYRTAGRTFTNTTPTGRRRTVVIDVQGRPLSIRIPGLHGTNYGYDSRGRLSVLSEGEHTATFFYNGQGYLDTLINPLGRKLSFAYDEAGRVTEEVLPDGREIHYTYDANGNLLSISPPGRPGYAFEYNATDHLVVAIPPDTNAGPQATQYHYNRDGQLIRVIHPDGRRAQLGYDKAGRLKTLRLPVGNVTYRYSDNTGKLISITGSEGDSLGYEYDGALPLSETWSGAIEGSIRRRFDNNFRVIEQRVNDGQAIAFRYDDDGLLIQAGRLDLTRTPENGLLTGTKLDTVSTQLTTDGFGEAVDYRATYRDQPLYHAAYVRDALGRITEKAETVLEQTGTYRYVYDLAGRLVKVTRNGITTTYAYDDNSNRLSETSAAEVRDGTYDILDRLLRYGNASYTYAVTGELQNRTQNGHSTHYDYDLTGNLRHVALADGTTIDYTVDAQDRRIGKRVNGVVVQGFLYDGEVNPIAELDGNSNLVSRFVYGARDHVPEYIVKEGKTYRLITDHLGSPRLVVNVKTGDIAQRMDHDALGRVLLDTNPGFQPFGFAGGLYDPDTGLVRFGARDYDPVVGRWTAPDPLGFASQDTNLYAYVYNDPVNNIDPSGLFLNVLVGCLAGGGMELAYQYFVEGRSGDCIDWADVGLGTLEGCMGGGLFSKLKKLRKLPCLGSSFTSATPVHTREGLKPIADIQLGDWVLSYDEATGTTGYQPVTHVSQTDQVRDLVKLTLNSGEQIQATAEHPFYIRGKGWNLASNLAVGQAIVRHNGETVVIEELDTSTEQAKVHNLTVARTHNYFVGKDGVLVHNKECTLVIGRRKDLEKAGAIGPDEKVLSWPPTASTKSEWKKNSGLLREEMNRGKPIRDASPDDKKKGTFLNMERNLLRERKWKFDDSTKHWMPPR